MTRPKYINKPFQDVPEQARIWLILYLAGFSLRRLSSLFRTPKSTIYDEIKPFIRTKHVSK